MSMPLDLPEQVWWPLTPIEGESLLGFATRTMDDNVLPHLAAVLRKAGQAHRNRASDIVWGDATTDAIAAVLGVSTDAVEQRRGRLHDGGRFLFHGVEMRAKDVYTRVRRFSPSSLARKPHHRSAWMMRQLPFCTESWEPLVSRCACGAAQDWVMVREPDRCSVCNKPLALTSVTPVPEAEQGALAIYAGLLSADPRRRSEALSRLPPSLADLDERDAFELALLLAPVVEPRIEGSARAPAVWIDQPLLLASALSRAVDVMLAWPDSLVRDACGLLPPAELTSRSPELLRIGRFLIETDRMRTPARVMRAIDAIGDAIRVPGSGEATSIDFAEAEVLIKRAQAKLRRAREAGTLATTFILRRGEFLTALDRHEVTGLAAIDCMAAATFAARFNLPAYAVEQFADEGVVGHATHPFVRTGAGHRIHAGEAELLIGKLKARAVLLEGQDSVPLATLFRSIGAIEKPYGAVFGALIGGGLPFELEAGHNLLTRISIRADDACRIREAASGSTGRRGTAEAYTQEDARDILNLHRKHIGALRALDHQRGLRSKLYEPASILELARTHVTVGEIAARLGRPPVAVKTALRISQVRPLSPFGYPRAEALRAVT